MNKEYYKDRKVTIMHILFASIPLIVLLLLALYGALDYLYIKHQVFVEKRVVHYCMKELAGEIIPHRHKTNKKYSPCRIWIGSDYTDPHPRTIPSDIAFPRSQSKQVILNRIISQLKDWNFDVVMQNDHTLHIEKKKNKFVISIIPINYKYKATYTCYRLIFTWIQPKRSPMLV